MVRSLLLGPALAAAVIVALIAGCVHGPRVATEVGDPRDRLDMYVEDLAGEYPGLWYGVVGRHGVEFSAGAGFSDVARRKRVNRNTAFNVFSIAKLFTSLVVVQLAAEQIVDLDREVDSYLPWVPYGGTVRHYLSHSAGVPNPMWGTFYIHWPEAHAEFEREAFLREVCRDNTNPEFTPGADVAYSNLGYAILGALIEDRTGQSYERAVQDRVFDRLGLGNAAFDPHRVAALSSSYISRSPITRILMRIVLDGVTFTREDRYLSIPADYYFDFPAHGGLVISPADLETFLFAVVSEDPRLLPPSGWRRWLEPQAVSSGAYTLGWRVEASEHGNVLAHAGGAMGHAAMLRLYPGTGLATYFQSNILDSMRIEKQDMDILDRLAHAVIE